MTEAARRLDALLANIPIARPGQKRRDPSPDELVVLKKYWGTGRPVTQMAKAFGVAENTIRRWVRECL